MVSKAFHISRKKLITFLLFFCSHSFSHFSDCVDSAMFLPETLLFVIEKFKFYEVHVNSGVNDFLKLCSIQRVVISDGIYLHLTSTPCHELESLVFFKKSGNTPSSRWVVTYGTVTP